MPVFLELFHGRKSVNEDLQDWGEQGPILGPLKYVHTTYGADLKLQTVDGVEGNLDVVGHELPDLVFYDGMFYGDWSVFSPEVLDDSWVVRIQQYDPAKAAQPATSHDAVSLCPSAPMSPTQLQPGYYWRTNDAADLAFSEAGPEQPTHINFYNLHDTLNRGEITQVAVGELQLITKAYFGERKVGWTGDAYKFGIYRRTVPSGRAEIAIVVSHGGGMEAYLLSDLVAVQTWTHLAANLSEELLWNMCYEIMHAHRAVKSEATRATMRLFLEGRLKKRKRRNRVTVEVLPPSKVG
jgi:hypothetical protein